jgi:hypothetical protein
VGSSIAFDGSASSDPDGTIVDFAFAFGDGTVGHGTASARAHLFSTSGTYTVTLTVTDDDGNTSSARVTVEITPTAPPTPASTNLKPLVAALFAAILVLVGAWSSGRAPWPTGSRRRLRAFVLAALPFVGAEAATGVVSFLTGLLTIPPLLGAGTAVDLAILVAGTVVSVHRVRKWKPAA